MWMTRKNICNRYNHYLCLTNFRTYSSLASSVVEQFKSILKEEDIRSGHAVRQQHSHDESYHRDHLPDIVVHPRSTHDVSAITKICNANGIPMVPFGTGTGLEGGVSAIKGGVCMNLTKMDQISALHENDFDVTVEPGVTRMALNTYLRDTGLWFPVDPGADASLCGMAATSASGTNAVRYGTMKENVLNLEVVLADGTIVHTAGKNRRSRKSAAGYNLTSLFVGSEGTLGIITKTTLKLYGIPEKMASAVVQFPSIQAAVDTCVQTMQCGIPIARIELLDENSMEAAIKFGKLDYLKPLPSLFLEFHGSENSVEDQSKTVEEIAVGNDGFGFRYSADNEERNKLWKARHNIFYSFQHLHPGKKGKSTDVCVPLSNLPKAIKEGQRLMKESGLPSSIVGHVGDGNFHILLFINENDMTELEKCEMVGDGIARCALDLDGTCTGEHGIGLGKRKLLREELGENGIFTMKIIKDALDPKGLMNPGKVL